MMYIIFWIYLLSLIAASWALPSQLLKGHASIPPIVATRNGSYYGKHSNTYNQDLFLGIPYAQPPVGDLRLRVAVPLNETWPGTRNATEYGPACIGYGVDTFIGAGDYISEDCLTLNVIVPSGYKGEKLPVGVWIYGGGFFKGSSRDPRYNLSFIVEQSVQIGKPFIGVSFNYRLSGWGFLYSKDVVEAGVANLGLRDQRLLLHWLQENIAAFGGDPTRVTLWGQSAGAASIGYHMLAYNGRDDKLFSGAIAESGSMIGFGLVNPIQSLAEELYHNLTIKTNCSTAPDKLACLRLIPASQYNTLLNSTTQEDYYNLWYGPLMDNDIIARNSVSQLKDGAFVKVPYISGSNTAEGTLGIPFGLNTDEQASTYFSGYDFTPSTLSTLLILYPHDPPNNIPFTHPSPFNTTIGTQWKRAATLLNDLGFPAPQRLVAKYWNKHTDVPLYSFRFNVIPNGIPDYWGATHFQEIPFVMGNVNGEGYPGIKAPYFGPDPFGGKPEEYKVLARGMCRLWAGFIAGGVPGFEGQELPEWPGYTPDNPRNLVFDAEVGSFVEEDRYREEQIGYLVERYEEGSYPWGAHGASFFKSWLVMSLI